MNVHARLAALLLLCMPLHAETGYAAWLRYAPIDDSNLRQTYLQLPAAITALDQSPVTQAAQKELLRAFQSMTGRLLRTYTRLPTENCILLATSGALKRSLPELALSDRLREDGYILKTTAARGRSILLIAGPNDRGVLYGTFA